jgi:hypothetical protein
LTLAGPVTATADLMTRNEIAALFGTLIIEPARGARHRLR